MILRALYVDADPVNGIFESVNLGRIGSIRVTFAQFFEFFAIQRAKNFAGADRMRPAAGVFRNALEQIEREQLF